MYFSLFWLDVVCTPHTTFCFLDFPFVLALKVHLSETVALSHDDHGTSKSASVMSIEEDIRTSMTEKRCF